MKRVTEETGGVHRRRNGKKAGRSDGLRDCIYRILDRAVGDPESGLMLDLARRHLDLYHERVGVGSRAGRSAQSRYLEGITNELTSAVDQARALNLLVVELVKGSKGIVELADPIKHGVAQLTALTSARLERIAKLIQVEGDKSKQATAAA